MSCYDSNAMLLWLSLYYYDYYDFYINIAPYDYSAPYDYYDYYVTIISMIIT